MPLNCRGFGRLQQGGPCNVLFPEHTVLPEGSSPCGTLTSAAACMRTPSLTLNKANMKTNPGDECHQLPLFSTWCLPGAVAACGCAGRSFLAASLSRWSPWCSSCSSCSRVQRPGNRSARTNGGEYAATTLLSGTVRLAPCNKLGTHSPIWKHAAHVQLGHESNLRGLRRQHSLRDPQVSWAEHVKRDTRTQPGLAASKLLMAKPQAVTALPWCPAAVQSGPSTRW